MQIEGQFPPEKTICKYRWSYPVVHVSRGEIRTCDKPINIQITEEMLQSLGTDAFLNNPYLMERRKEKLHGLRHSDCFTCIKLEDMGVKSTRTGAEVFTEYVNKTVGVAGTFEDFKYSKSSQLLRADHPDILEISMSNLCNLKCIYCSPVFSTLWEEEAIRHGEMNREDRERNFKAPPSFEKFFWEWFDQIKGSLKRIIFIGGEPLIQDKLYDYLEIIKKKVHHPIHINIISNFGAPDRYFDRFLALLPSLSEKFIVHIESSIEAYGEKAEYIRYGLQWSQFEKNVRKLLAAKHKNVRYGLQMAMNALCLSSLPKLLNWAADLQCEYQTMVDYKENIVVAPEYLCPLILTPAYANYLDEALEVTKLRLANPQQSFKSSYCKEWSHERWMKYIPFLESLKDGILRQASSDSQLRKSFLQFVDRNDKRRGSDFKKTFPEYIPFLKDCAEPRKFLLWTV